jgi:hypothetical protein
MSLNKRDAARIGLPNLHTGRIGTQVVTCALPGPTHVIAPKPSVTESGADAASDEFSVLPWEWAWGLQVAWLLQSLSASAWELELLVESASVLPLA